MLVYLLLTAFNTCSLIPYYYMKMGEMYTLTFIRRDNSFQTVQSLRFESLRGFV